MNKLIPNAFTGLEHLATAVLLLDGETRVLYANPAAEVPVRLQFASDEGYHSHRYFLAPKP